VRADTGSGDVQIDRVKGTYAPEPAAGRFMHWYAGGFEANTGSGRITLEQTSPGQCAPKPARRHGTSRRARLVGSQGGQRNDPREAIRRAHGLCVRARVAFNFVFPQMRFDLDAHTSSGSISVDRPVTVQARWTKTDQRQSSRRGVPVEVETGSGILKFSERKCPLRAARNWTEFWFAVLS